MFTLDSNDPRLLRYANLLFNNEHCFVTDLYHIMTQPSTKLVEKVLPDAEAVGAELITLLQTTADDAIKNRGIFTLGLSGTLNLEMTKICSDYRIEQN